MHPGDRRRGVSMRPSAKRGLRGLALLAVLLVAAAPVSPSRGQAATRDDIIGQLSQFETAPELDLAALPQKTLERSRSRSRNAPGASKRPPIPPQLPGLPRFNVHIH